MRQSPRADWEPLLMAVSSPDQQQYKLLSGWCDGSLDDAEMEQFDGLLRSDARFRDVYLKYMDQHAILAATLLPIGDVQQMVRSVGPAGDEPAGVENLPA